MAPKKSKTSKSSKSSKSDDNLVLQWETLLEANEKFATEKRVKFNTIIGETLEGLKADEAKKNKGSRQHCEAQDVEDYKAELQVILDGRIKPQLPTMLCDVNALKVEKTVDDYEDYTKLVNDHHSDLIMTLCHHLAATYRDKQDSIKQVWDLLRERCTGTEMPLFPWKFLTIFAGIKPSAKHFMTKHLQEFEDGFRHVDPDIILETIGDMEKGTSEIWQVPFNPDDAAPLATLSQLSQRHSGVSTPASTAFRPPSAALSALSMRHSGLSTPASRISSQSASLAKLSAKMSAKAPTVASVQQQLAAMTTKGTDKPSTIQPQDVKPPQRYSSNPSAQHKPFSADELALKLVYMTTHEPEDVPPVKVKSYPPTKEFKRGALSRMSSVFRRKKKEKDDKKDGKDGKDDEVPKWSLIQDTFRKMTVDLKLAFNPAILHRIEFEAKLEADKKKRGDPIKYLPKDYEKEIVAHVTQIASCQDPAAQTLAVLQDPNFLSGIVRTSADNLTDEEKKINQITDRLCQELSEIPGYVKIPGMMQARATMDYVPLFSWKGHPLFRFPAGFRDTAPIQNDLHDMELYLRLLPKKDIPAVLENFNNALVSAKTASQGPTAPPSAPQADPATTSAAPPPQSDPATTSASPPPSVSQSSKGKSASSKGPSTPGTLPSPIPGVQPSRLPSTGSSAASASAATPQDGRDCITKILAYLSDERIQVNAEVLARINELDRKFHKGELFYPEKYDKTRLPVFDETEMKSEIQGLHGGYHTSLLPKALEYFNNFFKREPRPELAREEAITGLLEDFEFFMLEMVENVQETHINIAFSDLKARARYECVPLVNFHQTAAMQELNLDDAALGTLWKVEVHVSLLPQPFKDQVLNAMEIIMANKWEEMKKSQFRPYQGYKAPPPSDLTYYTGPGPMLHRNIETLHQLKGIHDVPGNSFYL